MSRTQEGYSCVLEVSRASPQSSSLPPPSIPCLFSPAGTESAAIVPRYPSLGMLPRIQTKLLTFLLTSPDPNKKPREEAMGHLFYPQGT